MPETLNTCPHVVLVVLDSVRARNTTLSGYSRPTTPRLEALARDAVVYTNAISAAPSTVPSHASIFTGTHVSTHGLFVDGHRLSADFSTLAEVLRDAGYQTFGVCYQDDVSPATGLHRGFDQFEMDDEPSAGRRLLRRALATKRHIGPRPTARAKGDSTSHRKLSLKALKKSDAYRRFFWWGSQFSDQGALATQRKFERVLDQLEPGRPAFAYLHYDEAHLPYRPPRPWRKMFMDAAGRRAAPFVNQDRNKYFLGDAPMNAAAFEVLRSLYDGAIAYLDNAVGQVVHALHRRGLLDRTLLIVTGDHGDNIGEHGLMSHKFCLYDTLTRVPLVIRYPGAAGRGTLDERVVQLTDIVPTVLDVVGAPESAMVHQLEGNSLVSGAIMHRREEYAVSELIKPFGLEGRYLKALLPQYDRRLLSVRTARYRYVRASDGVEELYDLAVDQDEERNLLGDSGAGGPVEAEPLRCVAQALWPRLETCYERFKTEI